MLQEVKFVIILKCEKPKYLFKSFAQALLYLRKHIKGIVMISTSDPI